MKLICRRLTVLLSLMFVCGMSHAYDSLVDHLLEGELMYSGNRTNALKAFDGDASTYYSTNSSDMQWVGLDLGEPYVITRVGYTPMSGFQGADRMLLSIFEGANSPDFMDAVPLYLISQKPANGTATTADVNVSRGFRYVRYVGGAGSYCNVAELSFFGHAGEGDDSQFYQITNLPTLSVHVQDNILPTVKGEDFESQSILIYDDGTRVQEYPILFRVRGNYSASHENKAFRMKYNDGKSHHVMRGGKNESPAKAKKWVLINSYRDKTLMRNPVAWTVSKRVERNWTPWSQVVDLVVNGDYRGTYTLADAVSVDPHRIDITEMTADDVDDEFITGGYFIELDNYYDQEQNHFLSGKGNKLSIHEPDEEVLQPEQFQYIENTWNAMEDVAYSSNYADRENGLPSVFDLESFFSWFIASEFNGNTDMICQVFKYKERGDDHFYTGPIWDADLALENDETTYPANEYMDWTYKKRCSTGNWNQFLTRVLSEPSFFAQLQEMWARLRRKGNFEPNDLADDVDSLRNEVRASANLNFIRWPYLNQYLSLNPAVPGSWEAEVDRVRNFVRDRVAWMDQMLSYGILRQVGGVYQIASALDLCTFCQMVNELGMTDAKAALVNDIDMTEYNDMFQPIGLQTARYEGTFDGKGHTISNLHLSGTDAVGFFGYVNKCTISNIVFDESCSAEGTSHVAMLVGYVQTGVVNISGVENQGSVTASDGYAGGLVGYGRINSVFYVNNCCNTGAVTALNNAAALVAPSAGKVTVTNCYNIGTITGATEGKEFAYANMLTSIDNCWDYTSMQTNPLTPAQLDNGELCYRLNGNGERDTWRQNLDNGKPHDVRPVLSNRSGKVYEQEGRYTNINADAAKYRYYNLVITKVQGGYDGNLQFSEFDILDETLDEVSDLYVYSGGPDGYNNENWDNAADGSVYTKYCGRFWGNAYFLFDAGTEVDAYGYRIYTANDTGSSSDRNPCSWKLYGSNTQLYDSDDSGWTLIDEREDDWTMQPTNYEPYDFLIPHSIRSLTLNRHSATLTSGQELQLSATYTPAIIDNVTLQWTSTNENIATVDQNGLVVAVGLGTTDIIVSAPDFSTLRDTCTVTVVEQLAGYRYFQLAIEEIVEGSTIQFSEFALLDQNGDEITPLTTYAWTGTYIKDHDPDDLFDGDLSTKYCAAFEPTLYIYIDAGATVTISGYRITTAADTQSFSGRNPKTWSLFGSETQSDVPDDPAWTLLDRREDDTTLGAINLTPYDFLLDAPIIEEPATPYRYYNLFVTGLQGGDVLQFSEFDILDETVSEVAGLQTYGGPQYNNGSEGWPNLTDGDLHTKYCNGFGGSAYFLFDAGSEVVPYGYRISTAGDSNMYPERNPSSWTLYGSNTRLTSPYDSGWEVIDQRNGDTTISGTNYTPFDFFFREVPNLLTLDKHSYLLAIGEELQLQVSDRLGVLPGMTLLWESSDESVAYVDEQGLVFATGRGTADIIVTDADDPTLSDVCTLTVMDELPAHRYYQFVVEATYNNTSIQLSEFDLLDRDGNEVSTLSLYKSTGSSYSSDETQSKLFDNTPYSKYAGSFSTSNPVCLFMDAGQPVTLIGYRLTTANDTYEFPERNPVTWALYGSNTRSTISSHQSWTLLDRHEDDTTLGALNYTPYDFYFAYPQPVIAGDVNGDDVVDALDYQAMRLYIVGKPVEGFVPQAADLNGDGKINAQDLVELIKLL